MTPNEQGPLGDRHALYCGWVLAKARLHGLDCRPVLDDASNYTDRIEVVLHAEARPDGEGPLTLELVIPEPPDDWILEDWE